MHRSVNLSFLKALCMYDLQIIFPLTFVCQQNEGHHSEATWKIHLNAPRSPTSMKNPSLLTRMSTIRRTRRADSRSPARDAARARRQLGNNHSSDNLSLMEEVLINSQRNSEVSIFMKRNSDVNFLEPDEETTSISSLSKRHKGAIRAIRKLKYLVAKRKFKEALKPYDIKVSYATYWTVTSYFMEFKHDCLCHLQQEYSVIDNGDL